MSRVRTVSWLAVATLSQLAVACTDGDTLSPNAPATIATTTPHLTAATGNTATLLARGTFSDPKDPAFKIKRIAEDWHVELKATPAFDLAVQSIVFQPGGQSGWHRHPGPVFVQVVSGTTTEYKSDDPDCTPIVHSAGQSYVDEGEHAHIARNETNATATVVVTYFVPPGVPLRIDAPKPGNCPF
jgi:quercetin dioxygenase-like cupin family protein